MRDFQTEDRATLAATLLVVALAISPTVAGGERSASKGHAFVGGHIIGHGHATLTIRDGRIDAIENARPGNEYTVISVRGRYIAPTFIDSHVHLANGFSVKQLNSGGIAAAIDLSAPLSFLADNKQPQALRQSGPMVTAIKGYPTQSWGADGYGLEISGVDAARAAVDFLYASGARVIKVPVGDTTGGGAIPGMKENKSTLTDQELKAIVEQAHSHGLRVAAHAITDKAAMRAAAAGADVLAHTPTQALAAATVAAWSNRAIISTLAAFKLSPVAVENYRRFREAGATLMYGTDLGYTTIAAINATELELLGKAGLDGEAILTAGTVTPANYWGFAQLGTLKTGLAASFLVLDADPREDPSTLARPVSVYIGGVKVPPPAETDTQN